MWRALLLVLALGAGSGDAQAAVYRGHTSQGLPIALTMASYRVETLDGKLLDGCGTNRAKPIDLSFHDPLRIRDGGRFATTLSGGFHFRLVGRLAGHGMTGWFRLRAPGPRPGDPCDTGRVTFRAHR